MRIILTLISVALAAMLAVAATPAGAEEQREEGCEDPALVPNAAVAFDSYCAACHEADDISDAYFDGIATDERDRREEQLASFLDRHGACPHRHHEALAAWLRKLADD